MAVRSLLHYALEVPDQAVGQRYYCDFGLADNSRGGAAVRLRPAHQARESVLLYGGARKRLHHLCFGATGEDFVRTREAIRQAGVTEVDPPRQAPEGGLWLRDPDGNLLNVREETAPAPGPAESPTAFNGPGYAPRQAVRGAPPRDLSVAPRRLGHVLLFTPDIDRQVDFYSRVLGLKLWIARRTSSPLCAVPPIITTWRSSGRARPASITPPSRWAASTRSVWGRRGWRTGAGSPGGASAVT